MLFSSLWLKEEVDMVRRSRLPKSCRLVKQGLESQFCREPDYVIENILDDPKSEGIDKKTKAGRMMSKVVEAEARHRGIRKGDSLKRAQRLGV